MTYSPKIWLKHTQSTSYKDECTAFQWSESHLLLVSLTKQFARARLGFGLVIIIIYHIWWFSTELFQSSFEIWYFLHMSMWSKSGVVSPKADGVLIKLQRCHVSTFFSSSADTSMRATVTVSGKFVSFLRCSLLATQSHVDMPGGPH